MPALHWSAPAVPRSQAGGGGLRGLASAGSGDGLRGLASAGSGDMQPKEEDP